MVKSVLGVSHTGLRDWLFQRLSALIMAFYILGLTAFVACHGGLSYAEWHTLFSYPVMKIITILCLVSLLLHAWVGMWTIITDYIKPFVLACFAHLFVLFTLFACFIWGIMIVWSV